MKLLVGWSRCTVLGLLVMSLGLTLRPTPSGHAQTPKVLRVGLAEDPDILDPTLARTFVGRIVFASLCDKLYDIDPNLNIVPQLAASLPQLAADGKTMTVVRESTGQNGPTKRTTVYGQGLKPNMLPTEPQENDRDGQTCDG